MAFLSRVRDELKAFEGKEQPSLAEALGPEQVVTVSKSAVVMGSAEDESKVCMILRDDKKGWRCKFDSNE